ADDHRVLAERLPDESWPEDEGALARQAGAPLRGMPEPKDAALQRMYIFEPDRGCEIDQYFDETVNRYAGRRRAAEQGLYVFGRIIGRPGFTINGLPLLPAHARM